MVEMSLNGRLGNQLFMYAMARTAQIDSDSNIIYLNTSILENEHCANSLVNYRLPDFVCFYSKQERTISNSLHAPFYKNLLLMHHLKGSIKGKKLQNDAFYRKFGLFFEGEKYEEFDFSNRNYIYLRGYFQCEKYFEKYKDIILSDFIPKEPILPYNREKINEIKYKESVCVSLRLGDDYTKNKMYHVCTKKYFFNAIQYMREKLNKPVFYIFSDVTEGLSELFNNDRDMVFETGNDPDYEKLRVMSSCKHFIISNSSFSWWAQYLGNYENKIVVSPDRWYNLGIETDIMMDSWIKMET